MTKHAQFRYLKLVCEVFIILLVCTGFQSSCLPFGVLCPCRDRLSTESQTKGVKIRASTRELLSAHQLRLPALRPNIRQPPPTGILPSFLT